MPGFQMSPFQKQMGVMGVLGVLFLLSWFARPAASAAPPTMVVNDTLDLGDAAAGDGVCDSDSGTAGDQCSLRAAIEELNALGASAPPARIQFNIAGTGPFTITPATALPVIGVPLEIDGATQPGATCPGAASAAQLLIVLDGSAVSGLARGLELGAGSDGSTVRGLVIGNFGGDGLRLDSGNNIVRCNHLGLGADGVTGMGNGLTGVYIGGSGNTIGGQNAYVQRNVISDNFEGISISGADNRVRGNFIGTTADGLSAAGNSYGVYIGGNHNVIGSEAALGRNLISGNKGLGVRINTAEANVVVGNVIGLALDGSSPLPNAGNGIEVVGLAISNTIGGTGPGQLNLIAYNGRNGVALNGNVSGMPAQNPVRGNSLRDNGLLGIDLGDDGADSNDVGDGDGDENERQNFPVLAEGGSIFIISSLDSQASTQYSIDLYRSDTCDGSGRGEGQDWLLSYSTTSNGSGHASDLIDLAGLVSSGDVVTAAATDPNGNTSEFSACLTISLPPTATPSATPSPTPTPSATATAASSPTPTGAPVQNSYGLYLPLVQH
ncbi:MAG: hypothetical protein ABI847_11615 [Anaerolineales bacterium]